MKSLEELCVPEGKTLKSAAQDAKMTYRLMRFFSNPQGVGELKLE
jgi:hypothetical protein